MRIAVLTSSRADFGIYTPLLKAMQSDDYFDLKIIAFGTHLSRFHGYTKSQIEATGLDVDYEIDSMMLSDSKEAIANAIGLTIIKFATFWKEHESNFDLVFCLGDRYEMFAAVSSAIPFNIKIIHLHGGEKTLGAIDNSFRHSITAMSNIHLTSCKQHKNRVIEIIEDEERAHVYNVGSPALDNIKSTKLFSKEIFLSEYKVDLNKPTILFTYHPETKNLNTNMRNIKEII